MSEEDGVRKNRIRKHLGLGRKKRMYMVDSSDYWNPKIVASKAGKSFSECKAEVFDIMEKNMKEVEHKLSHWKAMVRYYSRFNEVDVRK